MKIYYRVLPPHMEGPLIAVVDSNDQYLDDVITIDTFQGGVLLTRQQSHLGVEHIEVNEDDYWPGGPAHPKLPSVPPSHPLVGRLHELSEEDRMKIFTHFCTHCGSDDPSCQCWNDE